MDFNDSIKFKWLSIENGKRFLAIEKFRPQLVEVKEPRPEGKNVKYETVRSEQIFEMVVKKPIFRQVPIFISKKMPLVLMASNVSVSTIRPDILNLKLGVTAWYDMGVFFDSSIPSSVQSDFVREFVAKTDFENLTSQYYATAQEQSVIEPNRGHQTLSDHLEIEKVKEERKKMLLGT
jgi:hypothetical protein